MPLTIVNIIARLNDGGPVRVLGALAPELVRRGHRVLVLHGDCAPDEPDRTDLMDAAGIERERVPGLQQAIHPLADLRAFRHLLRRLPQLNPDVVHTHTAKAGWLGRAACTLHGLTCLHTYHGHVLEGYFSRPVNAIFEVAERLAAGGHHHQALTPSQVLNLNRTFHVGNARRWHALPIPVAPVKPSPGAPWQSALRRRTPVVGFLGRLVPVKDIDLWLETLHVLSHHRPVQGLVCGDGPLRAHAEAKAASLALSVHFTGFVPTAEALGSMDVLLMTSRNEGMPLSAIEAAGAGIPVVAPPVGGLLDIIRWHGVRGAARTPEALADAVNAVLTAGPQREAAMLGGRRLASLLTPEALAPAYEALYQRLARRGT